MGAANPDAKYFFLKLNPTQRLRWRYPERYDELKRYYRGQCYVD